MVTFDGGWNIVIISKAPYNRYNPPRTCVANYNSISKLPSLLYYNDCNPNQGSLPPPPTLPGDGPVCQ